MIPAFVFVPKVETSAGVPDAERERQNISAKKASLNDVQG